MPKTAKKVGIAALLVLITILFVFPVRKYVINLSHGYKGEVREAQIIGSFSGYSSRVEEIQKILKDLGFEPGPVDGRMGIRTRFAIKRFQKKKGITATGKIDSKTWSELNNEKEKITMDSKDIQPESEKISRKSEIQDNIMSYRLKSKERTQKAQIALKRAGFYTGDIDGKIGPQTKKAIKAFQKSKGLNPDGIIGVKTWEEIVEILKEVKEE